MTKLKSTTYGVNILQIVTLTDDNKNRNQLDTVNIFQTYEHVIIGKHSKQIHMLQGNLYKYIYTAVSTDYCEIQVFAFQLMVDGVISRRLLGQVTALLLVISELNLVPKPDLVRIRHQLMVENHAQGTRLQQKLENAN